MEKYKRLTERDENGIATYKHKCDADSFEENMYIHAKREEAVLNRLAEIEDKIENGTLIDTITIRYEKEEDKDRYKIYKLFPTEMIFDFAKTKEEAEKKIKELKGEV